jgi:hypothetical protein
MSLPNLLPSLRVLIFDCEYEYEGSPIDPDLETLIEQQRKKQKPLQKPLIISKRPSNFSSTAEWALIPKFLEMFPITQYQQ